MPFRFPFTEESSGSERLSNLSKVRAAIVKRAKLEFRLRRPCSTAQTLSLHFRWFFLMPDFCSVLTHFFSFSN